MPLVQRLSHVAAAAVSVCVRAHFFVSLFTLLPRAMRLQAHTDDTNK